VSGEIRKSYAAHLIFYAGRQIIVSRPTKFFRLVGANNGLAAANDGLAAANDGLVGANNGLAAANNETAGAKQSVYPWKFHKHQSKRDENLNRQER